MFRPIHWAVHQVLSGLSHLHFFRHICLGGSEWSVQSFQLSPEMFGFPVVRKRLYSLCIHADVEYFGCVPSPLFHSHEHCIVSIQDLFVVCVSCPMQTWSGPRYVKVAAINQFLEKAQELLTGPALTVDEFLLSEYNADADLTLTKLNRKFLEQYMDLFGPRGATVVDLQQNPQKRPRWGSAMFPTLTTGCSKMMNMAKHQLYSEGPSWTLDSLTLLDRERERERKRERERGREREREGESLSR